jgi:hypothetical protein
MYEIIAIGAVIGATAWFVKFALAMKEKEPRCEHWYDGELCVKCGKEII